MAPDENISPDIQVNDDSGVGLDRLGEKMRMYKRISLLVLLALAFGCSLGLFVKYLLWPAPLPDLIAPDTDIFNYPPHYLFSIYGVDKPVGITLSLSGNRIYVSESGGDRLVWIFDREGIPLGNFSPPQTRPAERSPVYLTVDSRERIFVTDRLQHAIFAYDPDGNYLDTLLSPDLSLSGFVDLKVGGMQPGTSFAYNLYTGFTQVWYPDGRQEILPAPGDWEWSPLGIWIDAQDSLFITNVVDDHNWVRKFVLPSSAPLPTWRLDNLSDIEFGATGSGDAQFSFPNAVMADSQGRVFVSDGNNGRISVWDANGGFLFTFGTGTGDGSLNLPRGIFIDSRDRLYVVDAVGQDIKVFDISGEMPEYLYRFGGFGIDDGLFNYPNDIVIDQSGRIYIVDRENDRIQVWSY